MSLAITYGFALALLVAGHGWLAWRISATRRALGEVVSRAAIARGHFANLLERVTKVEKTTPVALAAEVAALSEAVANLAATQRRFAGRMDRRYQLDRGDGDDDGPDDPKWRALMQLQQNNGGR